MDLFINLLVSTVGLAYFIYGKKADDSHFLISGVILMIYPYFVNELFLILLGVVLLAAPFITKKYF